MPPARLEGAGYLGEGPLRLQDMLEHVLANHKVERVVAKRLVLQILTAEAAVERAGRNIGEIVARDILSAFAGQLARRRPAWRRLVDRQLAPLGHMGLQHAQQGAEARDAQAARAAVLVAEPRPFLVEKGAASADRACAERKSTARHMTHRGEAPAQKT